MYMCTSVDGIIIPKSTSESRFWNLERIVVFIVSTTLHFIVACYEKIWLLFTLYEW